MDTSYAAYNLLVSQMDSLNELRLREYLEYHGLEWLPHYVRAENKGHLNPYHNTAHMEQVARVAVELYRGEIVRLERMLEPLPTFRERDTHEKALLVAGLFHDFNHSGGKETDDKNIDAAVIALDGCAEKILSSVGLGSKFIDYVAKLIILTEFPFIATPTRLDEMCLRDADLLSIIEPSGPTQVLSMRHELNLNHPEDKKITAQEMYERQVQFVENIKLYTPSAQRLFYNAITPAMGRMAIEVS